MTVKNEHGVKEKHAVMNTPWPLIIAVGAIFAGIAAAVLRNNGLL